MNYKIDEPKTYAVTAEGHDIGSHVIGTFTATDIGIRHFLSALVQGDKDIFEHFDIMNSSVCADDVVSVEGRYCAISQICASSAIYYVARPIHIT